MDGSGEGPFGKGDGLNTETPRPDLVYPGEVLPQESEWRRLLRAGTRVLTTTFDLGFLVLGTAMLGLAAAILLDGVGVTEGDFTVSVGEMLGAALVIAVLGAFGLGVAVEGPINRGTDGLTLSYFEQALMRAVSLLVVGAGLVVLGRVTDQFTTELPQVFMAVTRFVAVTGFAGMTATAVVGTLSVWAIQRLAPGRIAAESELPILYVVWALGAAILFTL